MKTTRTLALLMGVFATILFFSCKKSDHLTSSSGSDDAAGARIVLISDSEPSVPVTCDEACIDPAGPYIESIKEETQTWGNTAHPHWKKVNHAAYNTATSFIVNVTFTHSGGNSSNTVSVTAFGETKMVTTLASGATESFTFDLPADWKACDAVPYSIYQEGQNSPMRLSYSYNLYGVCEADKDCETSFTGEAIACGTEREAVYTLTAKDAIENFKIQGGLTNFTGADAEVIVTGGTGITTSQWTPGGSSNRVIKVEGNIEACGVITIRIKWNSTNSGGIITGSWSVSANGSEVAPAVAGLECQ